MPDQRSLPLAGKDGLRHDHRHIFARHAGYFGRSSAENSDLEKEAPGESAGTD
jgi:hypothetical protein